MNKFSLESQLNQRSTKRLFPSYALEVWKYFRKNTLALLGLAVMLILIVCAILAPLIAPAGYAEQKYLTEINAFPSLNHWFGVDAMGRDYFSRVIYGIRVSLSVGFMTACIALFIGVPLGALAGFFSGIIDWIIMRLVETFSVIPPLLVAILFVTLFGSGLQNVIIILALVSWMDVCRLVRGEILALKEREYSRAAKAIGVTPYRILFRHLLPNAMAPIIVGMVLCVPNAIMMEASLSFLGVGINPPTPSWGQMISDGLYYIQFYWHLTLFPAIFLALTVLSLSFIGDGLRDAMDPKLRGRR
ncbi:peptide ABC transporter permease [candidate division KSB3 bacterium]|uniref:Peptide ABC transporter permease n=1 Tax=candidate division KSB3 bacterium TaxID=2044937 RepID=A0A2G6KJ81_9BACT|nr:MAG: peptide ABC transporter permease [candidate division KSB3 bacterium]